MAAAGKHDRRRRLASGRLAPPEDAPRAALHLIGLGVAIAVAYANSFAGVFLFDDQFHINSSLASTVIGPACLRSGRGVVQCTLALDYRRGGLLPVPYHVTNLGIHVAVAVLLYALVRRALELPRVAMTPRSASRIALVTAVLWAVHPLTTESVTYIVQRSESLVTLFYLATLYAALREGRAWMCVAIACCFLGMCTKPVMATAPLAAFLVEATLVSGSVCGALRRRMPLWTGLAATWGWLLVLLDNGRQLVSTGAGGTGFASAEAGITPARYLLTQAGVILSYLRLAIAPYGLSLDHRRLAAHGVAAIVPMIVVASMVLYGVWALVKKRVDGLLVTLFFLVLAPTSSLMPIVDLEVEHRMYLPLAVVVLACVLLARRLTRGLDPRLGSACAVAIGVVLAMLTHARNEDYRSPVRMYAHDVQVNEENERAHVNLANALSDEGDPTRAIEHYRRALRINPAFSGASGYLAALYLQRGERDRARETLEVALAYDARSADLQFARAAVALLDGDRVMERARLERVVVLAPEFAAAHADLGDLDLLEGRRDQAVREYELALRLDPNDTTARAGLQRCNDRAP